MTTCFRAGGPAGSNYTFLTRKERDNETGLDFFGARYFASSQGRFTSTDPLLSSATIYDPQTWNRYSYVLNNPLRFVDPFGLYEWDASLGGGSNGRGIEQDEARARNSGVADTPDVSFEYDAAGNRTSMTDGTGSTAYVLDSLSRISSETRTITGLGAYTIGYDYNLAGQLSSVTDPTGKAINYGYDVTGRLNAVTGMAFGGVTTYASGLKYRAWGGLKQLSYGDNPKTMETGYNSRMQATSFSVTGLMSKSYSYYEDGSLKSSSESTDHHFDRAYGYDQVGRLTQALSGAEARGEPATNDRPYNETFNYDALNHLSSRQSKVWTWVSPYAVPDVYTNNRSSNAVYDAEGNQTANIDANYTYDAAGNISTVSTSDQQSTTTRTVDGNGQQLKTVTTTTYNEGASSTTETTYYVPATVLDGQVLTELNAQGQKQRTFVYAGKQVLATQEIINTQSVRWEHRDPTNASYRTSYVTGAVAESRELDPTGADTIAPPVVIVAPNPEEGTGSLLPYPSFSSPTRPGLSYRVDGIPVTVDYFMMQMQHAQFDVLSPPRLRNYEVTTRYGTRDFGTDRRGAFAYARENGTLIRNWIVSDSWTLDGLPHGQPQNLGARSTGTVKGAKESKECAEHRARLLNDPEIRSILDSAWKRSQFGTANAHEVGGLLGDAIDHGMPSQKDRRIDTRFTNPPNLPPAELGTTFGPWAKSQMGRGSGVVNYTYWYHTHPFTEGDVVQGVVLGNPNHPSLIHGDADVSQQIAMTGVVVSKTRIVVFGMFGEKCSFRR